LKSKLFSDQINAEGYELIKAFIGFDNRYTAPLHGYADALDFYEKASVDPYLKNLQIPSLIVQAKNDAFLLPNCIPIDAAQTNPFIFLEIPHKGGHCGFMEKGQEFSWAEKRALGFAQNY